MLLLFLLLLLYGGSTHLGFWCTGAPPAGGCRWWVGWGLGLLSSASAGSAVARQEGNRNCGSRSRRRVGQGSVSFVAD